MACVNHKLHQKMVASPYVAPEGIRRVSELEYARVQEKCGVTSVPQGNRHDEFLLLA